MSVRSLFLAFLLALPAVAEFEPWEWASLDAERTRLGGSRGDPRRKLAWITSIRREDSARVAEALQHFAYAAAVRREDLAPRADKAAEEFRSIDRMLRQKYGKGVKSEVLEANAMWKKRRTALRELNADLETESLVLQSLGEAFATLRSKEATRRLATLSWDGLAPLRNAREVRAGVLAALCAQPGDEFETAILAFATDADPPEMRVKVLDRIAAKRMPGGFDVAARCVKAAEPLVARVAVATLRALDDPRAVPHLVAARARSKGLLAAEIDLLLFRFTGRSFSGAGAEAMWEGWWKAEGEVWLAAGPVQRFEGGAGGAGDTEFYGIETRSNRIVFVLDRSQSMRHPVPKKGPVTGAGEGPPQGGTKLEVAKNQLERTIQKLPPDVSFGVVFYGGNVQVWRQPPGLMPATPESRKSAIEWFEHLEPLGSTPTFEALSRALEYCKVGGGKSTTDPAGADTIFLLSDGAPTDGEALLKGDALDAAIQRFLEANRPFRCVVHTIGVGPDHNGDLMKRLARETGGTYRAVGVD